MAQRIRHADVEGLRVGRFPGMLTGACILYRLGDTVIDTGPPNQWRTVRRFLAERQIQRVVVTHHHEDHSGNLASIEVPEILAPEGGLAALRQGFPLRLYQHIIWGRPRTVRAEPLPAEIPLADGGKLIALPAPGHSADMTCFLEPERGWLFTGDLYIASKTRYLRQDEDLRDQIDSLRRIQQLDFGTVFCSHRGVLEDGKDALARKLDFLSSLCERVADLRSQGKGIYEVTRLLLGREDMLSWMTGFHFAKRHLIAACFEIAAQSEVKSASA